MEPDNLNGLNASIYSSRWKEHIHHYLKNDNAYQYCQEL